MKVTTAIVGCVLMLGMPVAAEVETRPASERVGPLEVMGDAMIPDTSGEKVTGALADVERNGYRSVQVNVDGDGLNILGDAANEPSLAVDPTAPNRMVIGWREFNDVNSSFRQAGVAYSHDGGRNWTFPGVHEPGVFRSDPVLGADADGRFYYYSLRGDFLCHMLVSDDGGESWSDPVPAFGGDKAWMTVDRTDGIGRNNIYVSWSTAANPWGTRVFTRSLDGGASFQDPLTLTPAPIWGSTTVGPDGELYIAGNAGFIRDLFVVWRSFDARDPLVEPTFDSFIADLGGVQVLQGAPNPVGLSGQIWVDVDRSDGPMRGTVYLVGSVEPRGGGDPMDVHLVRSTDQGETWSTPVKVAFDDRGAWQWFGTMSMAPNGRIDVVWVESLAAGSPNLGELYYASSSDGGFTWSDAQAVSPVFDSHLGWPRQNKLGDYYHMVSDNVGADLAWAATFNGEQDVYYSRLGARDCNRNSLADSEDLATGLEADCDNNLIPDSCEIAADPTLDGDLNGSLDVCSTAPRRSGARLRP